MIGLRMQVMLLKYNTTNNTNFKSMACMYMEAILTYFSNRYLQFPYLTVKL